MLPGAWRSMVSARTSWPGVDMLRLGIPVKSYIFSASLTDFRVLRRTLKILCIFMKKWRAVQQRVQVTLVFMICCMFRSPTAQFQYITGIKPWCFVQKVRSNALCCTQCHSVLVCVTVYACWTWFVFLDVVIFYIFVGFLCFLVKTYGPTIITL